MSPHITSTRDLWGTLTYVIFNPDEEKGSLFHYSCRYPLHTKGTSIFLSSWAILCFYSMWEIPQSSHHPYVRILYSSPTWKYLKKLNPILLFQGWMKYIILDRKCLSTSIKTTTKTLGCPYNQQGWGEGAKIFYNLIVFQKSVRWFTLLI